MSKKTGLMLVLFTALISGVSIFINKFGIGGINPYVFTFAKNITVSLLLFSIIIFFKEFAQIKVLNKNQWLKLVLIGFFGGSIPFLLFFKGLSMTSAATASFIHKTMFVYAAILACIFLKEKLNKGLLLAGFLLITGNFLLLKLKFLSLDLGALLVLIATVLWAVEFTISKNALKDIKPNIVAFGRMGFGSLFILIFLASTANIPALFTLTLPQLAWAGITSIFLLFYVITWYSGLKWIDVSVASCILLLGSPVTTMLSYIFLGTQVSIMEAAGMLLIIAGIASAVYSSYFAGNVKLSQQHTNNG